MYYAFLDLAKNLKWGSSEDLNAGPARWRIEMQAHRKKDDLTFHMKKSNKFLGAVVRYHTEEADQSWVRKKQIPKVL